MMDAFQQPKRFQVWHIPQIPGRAFEVEVSSPELGAFVMETLAKYDDFQYWHHIKPDYSSVQGLNEWDPERQEWFTWYDDDGNDIKELRLTIDVMGNMTLVRYDDEEE